MRYNKIMKQKCKDIYNILYDIYKVPKCELEYGSLFQLLVAVILSAQCTDKRVNLVTKELFKKYKTCDDFLTLTKEQLEEKIHSCGFYHNKAKNILKLCQELKDRYNGLVPSNMDDLLTLSGVGRKTANVVLSEGFKKNAIAVDTHVFRVSHRLGLSNSKTADKTEEDLKKLFDEDMWSNLHLYLVLYGRYVCKSLRPKCVGCRLQKYCNYYKEKICL